MSDRAVFENLVSLLEEAYSEANKLDNPVYRNMVQNSLLHDGHYGPRGALLCMREQIEFLLTADAGEEIRKKVYAKEISAGEGWDELGKRMDDINKQVHFPLDSND